MKKQNRELKSVTCWVVGGFPFLFAIRWLHAVKHSPIAIQITVCLTTHIFGSFFAVQHFHPSFTSHAQYTTGSSPSG